MNDVAVAETISRLVGVSNDGSSQPPRQPRRASGALPPEVTGWHRRRAAEIDIQLVKDWNSFVRAEPFWLHEQNAAAS